MNKECIMKAVLEADPGMLAKVANVLEGRIASAPVDRTLLTITATAKALGLSRMSVWRLLHDGRLNAIVTRGGRRRIPVTEIDRFLGRAVA